LSPEPAITLHECRNIGTLSSRFDSLRHSDNVFFALRVGGTRRTSGNGGFPSSRSAPGPGRGSRASASLLIKSQEAHPTSARRPSAHRNGSSRRSERGTY
jgi:hypothetical protein